MTNTNEVKAEMARYGYTIDSLAKEMGLSANALSYKIRNIKQFRVEEIVKMSELLKVESAERKVQLFLYNP